MPSKFQHAFDYVSTGRTGTGGAETITHALGRIPNVIIVNMYDSTLAWSITPGSSTGSVVVVTVAQGAQYDLFLAVTD